MTLGTDALLSMLPKTGSAILAGRLFGGFTLAFPEYTLAPFSEMFGPFTADGKKALFLSCHQTLLFWHNDRSLFVAVVAGTSLAVWRGVSASEKMNLKEKARCQIAKKKSTLLD